MIRALVTLCLLILLTGAVLLTLSFILVTLGALL